MNNVDLDLDEEELLDEELKQLIRDHFPDHLNSLSMQAITESLEAQNQVDSLERELEAVESKDLSAKWHYFKKYWKIPSDEDLEDEIEFLKEQIPKAEKNVAKVEAFRDKVKEVKKKVDDLDADDFMGEEE